MSSVLRGYHICLVSMGRTPCCNVDGLKKGAWTSEEDQKLVSYIKEHGEGGWRTLPLKAGLQRCGKSCRLRWANYLRPDIKRGEFSPQEEHRIIELHSSLGNRWSAIARHLPKRTDNEIKNYWNTHLKKRLSSDKAPGLDQTTTQSNPKGPTTATAVAAGGEEEEEEEEEEQQQPPPDHGHVSSSSSSTSSASAQLLNKLAAKFAPRHHRRKNNNNGTEEDREEEEEEEDGGEDEEEEEGEETGNDVVLPRGQVGSSAKLLNKMATRLAHPMHCLNTLKSILSSAAAGSIGSSMMMQRCPSTSSLHSYSTAATSASASDVISMSISNNNNNNNNVATSMSNNDAPENADNQNQALAFLDDLDLDRVLNDDDWPQFDQTVHFDLDTTTAERLVQGSDNNYYINNYNNNDGGFIDLEEQPSTSAASKSTNYDHMDDYYYDNGYYGVDQQMRAATTTTTTTTTSDDAYGHQQFDYIHSLGGLLDGDDEYGRTFWNNYDDAPAAASFF